MRSYFDAISAVTPAAGDEAPVSEFLAGSRAYQHSGERAIAPFRHLKIKKGERLLKQGTKAYNRGEQGVAGWGLRDCLIED